jgi:formylglycine-generating enzyme required for sulfatase activity
MRRCVAVGISLFAALLLLGSRARLARSYVEPVTGMQFEHIPAGTFVMGSPLTEVGHREDERPHTVTLSRPFYLGTFEVTQRQWVAIMGTNPSHFKDGGLDLPVESINWYEAQRFLQRLSQRGGKHFRLPTEAEWEYACRAGTRTAYAVGDTLSTTDANYDGRYPLPAQAPGVYRASPVKVGSLRANQWRLYDMHGNVWEWCEDDYCAYASGPLTDPIGVCKSGRKVIRGGSWYFNADSERSALRYTHRPQDRGFSLGFRVVMDVP